MKRATNEICEVVADEGTDRSRNDDQKEVLISGACGNPTDNHRGFAGYDRHYRVEQSDDKNDGEKPSCARCINQPVGESCNDAVSRCGENDTVHGFDRIW